MKRSTSERPKGPRIAQVRLPKEGLPCGCCKRQCKDFGELLVLYELPANLKQTIGAPTAPLPGRIARLKAFACNYIIGKLVITPFELVTAGHFGRSTKMIEDAGYPMLILCRRCLGLRLLKLILSERIKKDRTRLIKSVGPFLAKDCSCLDQVEDLLEKSGRNRLPKMLDDLFPGAHRSPRMTYSNLPREIRQWAELFSQEASGFLANQVHHQVNLIINELLREMTPTQQKQCFDRYVAALVALRQAEHRKEEGEKRQTGDRGRPGKREINGLIDFLLPIAKRRWKTKRNPALMRLAPLVKRLDHQHLKNDLDKIFASMKRRQERLARKRRERK